MDFDGEKLAIGKFINSTDDNSCTFYIAVFDHSGLISYSLHPSSLNTHGGINYNDYCRPNDTDPIFVEWVK